MPSFADSIFLFVLALLLFGPKKLPVLARELGKWVGEFRRASNEFKMQMEDELRASEQTERQKQIAAMEAAAPVPPPLGEPAEEDHPHLRPPARTNGTPPPPLEEGAGSPFSGDLHAGAAGILPDINADVSAEPAVKQEMGTQEGVRPMPIATSGELHMMPPATGLPTPRGRNGNPLGGGLLDAIPEAAHEAREDNASHKVREVQEILENRQEATAHGD